MLIEQKHTHQFSVVPELNFVCGNRIVPTATDDAKLALPKLQFRQFLGQTHLAMRAKTPSI